MALGHFESENSIARYFSGLSFKGPKLAFPDYSPPNDRCSRGYYLPKGHQYCRIEAVQVELSGAQKAA